MTKLISSKLTTFHESWHKNYIAKYLNEIHILLFNTYNYFQTTFLKKDFTIALLV
jgi:hypothetical protein